MNRILKIETQIGKTLIIICTLTFSACGRLSVLPKPSPGPKESAAQPGDQNPSKLKEAITQIVTPLIDPAGASGKSLGMIVGVITPNLREIYGYGTTTLGANNTPNGDTLYGLASNTKVFTGLLLALQVTQKKMLLNDSIDKYMAPGIAPHFKGASITMQNLADYKSALPLFASNMQKGTEATYSAGLLNSFLSSYILPYAPNTKYSYSNIAFQLLGEILSSQNKLSYDSLLKSALTGPLKMSDTVSIPTASQLARLAPMYVNRQVYPWPNVPMPGAGWVMSSGNDMLTYLSALTGIEKNLSLDILSAIEIAETQYGPIPKAELHAPNAPEDVKAGLGMSIYKKDSTTYFAKMGGGHGIGTQVIFTKNPSAGVFILTTTVSNQPVAITKAAFRIYEALMGLPANSMPRFSN